MLTEVNNSYVMDLFLVSVCCIKCSKKTMIKDIMAKFSVCNLFLTSTAFSQSMSNEHKNRIYLIGVLVSFFN